MSVGLYFYRNGDRFEGEWEEGKMKNKGNFLTIQQEHIFTVMVQSMKENLSMGRKKEKEFATSITRISMKVNGRQAK